MSKAHIHKPTTENNLQNKRKLQRREIFPLAKLRFPSHSVFGPRLFSQPSQEHLVSAISSGTASPLHSSRSIHYLNRTPLIIEALLFCCFRCDLFLFEVTPFASKMTHA